MSNEELNSNTVRDPNSQRAMDLAVKFYEADQKLTRDDREILENAYAKVTYMTTFLGWGSFFCMFTIPFYRRKLMTGSSKGTSMGTAFLCGFAGMAIGASMTSQFAYNYNTSGLEDTNPRCYEVAKILKPAESVKWMLYYKMTKDHPEHIMKDPRSKEAEAKRNKSPMQNRDVLGLHTGPRAIIARGPPKEEEKKNDDEFGFDGDSSSQSQEQSGISSWDKIRLQNGIKTNQSGSSNSSSSGSWTRIRQESQSSQQSQAQANPFSTNVYKPANNTPQYDDQAQSEFDKLLEKERSFGEQEDREKKW